MFVAGLSTSKEYYQIFLRLLFVSGLLFGAVPSFGGAEEGGSVQVTQSFGLKRLNYLDGRIEVVDKDSVFNCSDRVWGVFEIENLSLGIHELITRWHSPSGEVVSSRKIRTNVRDSSKLVFLSSFVEVESGASVFSFLDPGAGYEAYIGKWITEIESNGAVIGKSGFEMLC